MADYREEQFRMMEGLALTLESLQREQKLRYSRTLSSIPTTLGPEGVQYTEKFGILKVLLNDTLFTSL